MSDAEVETRFTGALMGTFVPEAISGL